MHRFTDKVIVVTGAASGIGAATARRFASEAARIVAVDINPLDQTIGTMPDGQAIGHVADVSDPEQVDAMLKAAIDKFGHIDVLVNNAGVHAGGRPDEIGIEDWRKVIATDLDGVFSGCRAAIPYLEETGGNIVNTASVSGTGGDWNASPYNAAHFELKQR